MFLEFQSIYGDPCGFLFKDEQNKFIYCCSKCGDKLISGSELEQHTILHDIKIEDEPNIDDLPDCDATELPIVNNIPQLWNDFGEPTLEEGQNVIKCEPEQIASEDEIDPTTSHLYNTEDYVDIVKDEAIEDYTETENLTEEKFELVTDQSNVDIVENEVIEDYIETEYLVEEEIVQPSSRKMGRPRISFEKTCTEGKCALKPRVFRERSRYNAHIFVHQDPQFECDICGRAMKHKTNMKKHKKTEHGIQ